MCLPGITGIVSQSKLLSLLPFISDPRDEMEMIKKENEDSIDTEYFTNTNRSNDGEINE